MTNGPPIHKDNENWRSLKSWLLKAIHGAQRQLEAVGPSEIEHNATRGKIAAWRELIAAVEPTPLPESSNEGDYFDDEPPAS
jgi:hypothetical protein